MTVAQCIYFYCQYTLMALQKQPHIKGLLLSFPTPSPQSPYLQITFPPRVFLFFVLLELSTSAFKTESKLLA